MILETFKIKKSQDLSVLQSKIPSVSFLFCNHFLFFYLFTRINLTIIIFVFHHCSKKKLNLEKLGEILVQIEH
jgi:hypothetical protein